MTPPEKTAKKRGGYRPGSGRPRTVGPTTEKAMAYANLVKSGVSKSQAVEQAGYSPTAGSGAIERIPAVKNAMQTVDQQRERLQQHPDFSFHGIAHRLKNRATNKKVNAKVQTDNDKALISIMGYNAPAQVNVRSTGLLLEFSDLSAADLVSIRDALMGEGVEEGQNAAVA